MCICRVAFIFHQLLSAVYDSRSGGHVLLRFLPVRFESCLNDAPRLRNTLSVFQGRKRERGREKERDSGVGEQARAGRKRDWGTLRAAHAVGLLQGNNNKSCIN